MGGGGGGGGGSCLSVYLEMFSFYLGGPFLGSTDFAYFLVSSGLCYLII